MESEYALDLIELTKVVVQRFKHLSDEELNLYIKRNIPKWGSEFTKESLVRGFSVSEIGFYIRKLMVIGNGVESASVEFKKGLNVISGPSDIGNPIFLNVSITC